jgi:hypothetical protein
MLMMMVMTMTMKPKEHMIVTDAWMSDSLA